MTKAATPTSDTPVREHVTLDSDTTQWLEALRQAREQLHHWEQIVERATDKVKAALGDAEEGLVDGHVAVRWTFVNSSRVDIKKLEAEHPDIAAQFRVPTVTRRFTIADPS